MLLEKWYVSVVCGSVCLGGVLSFVFCVRVVCASFCVEYENFGCGHGGHAIMDYGRLWDLVVMVRVMKSPWLSAGCHRFRSGNSSSE